MYPVLNGNPWDCFPCRGTGEIESIEFKIHDLPQTKETDIIEVRTYDDLPASFISSLGASLRECGHKGTILVLNKRDSEIEFGVISAENSKKNEV